MATDVTPSPDMVAHITSNPESMSTMDLLHESVANAALLAKRQIELFRLELEDTRRREVRSLLELAGAGVLGVLGVVFLLFAAMVSLAHALGLPEWEMSLLMAAPILASGVILFRVSWGRRVRELLPISRGEVAKELAWLKTNL